MNESGESFSPAIERSLSARGSGAKPPHPHQPENCLNCRTGLVGAYCHACGQQAHIYRAIGGFLHDLLHGALHFEGKIWRTLPMLALRPGTLTRRYVAGARARFVSPMALFLFSVFLVFAVFQAIGISAPADVEANTDLAGGVEAAQNLAESKVENARAELAGIAEDDPRRPALQRRLTEAESDLANVQTITGLTRRTPTSLA